jgi:hypothetical protein
MECIGRRKFIKTSAGLLAVSLIPFKIFKTKITLNGDHAKHSRTILIDGLQEKLSSGDTIVFSGSQQRYSVIFETVFNEKTRRIDVVPVTQDIFKGGHSIIVGDEQKIIFHKDVFQLVVDPIKTGKEFGKARYVKKYNRIKQINNKRS